MLLANTSAAFFVPWFWLRFVPPFGKLDRKLISLIPRQQHSDLLRLASVQEA